MKEFTQRVEAALNSAQSLALSLQHAELKPLHVLAAFIDINESLAAEVAAEQYTIKRLPWVLAGTLFLCFSLTLRER